MLRRLDVVTLEKICAMGEELPDAPCLMIGTPIGMDSIQCGHFKLEDWLKAEPIIGQSRWVFVCVTSSNVPIFRVFPEDRMDVLRFLSFEPDINAWENESSTWITPIAFPREQTDYRPNRAITNPGEKEVSDLGLK